MYIYLIGRLDGWMVGRLDGWTAGRLDGWTVGRSCAYMNQKASHPQKPSPVDKCPVDIQQNPESSRHPEKPSLFVSIRQHTPAYVSRSSSQSVVRHLLKVGIRLHTTSYVSIRQHASTYVSRRSSQSASHLLKVSIRHHTSAYVSIRQHTSAYVSIRQQKELPISEQVPYRRCRPHHDPGRHPPHFQERGRG
jgi:hypothetical protein